MDGQTLTESLPSVPSGGDEKTLPVHVGIHITCSEVSLVSVKGTKREWSVGRFALLPLPQKTVEVDEVENPEVLTNTLLALWKLAGVDQYCDSVRIAVDGPQVTFTKKTDDTESLVRSSIGLTRGVIQQLGKAKPGQVVITAPEMLTMAVRESTNAWPVKPLVVPSGFAALRSLGVNEDKEPRVLVIMNGERNTVALERDGKVAVIRTYDGVGKSNLVESWLKRGIEPALSDIEYIAKQAVDSVRSPAFVVDGEVSVHLAGSAAQLPGLAETVENQLGFEVSVPDVTPHVQETALFPSQQKKVSSRLTVATGAALLGAAHSKVHLP